jgi:hypothetical protein
VGGWGGCGRWKANKVKRESALLLGTIIHDHAIPGFNFVGKTDMSLLSSQRVEVHEYGW